MKYNLERISKKLNSFSELLLKSGNVVHVWADWYTEANMDEVNEKWVIQKSDGRTLLAEDTLSKDDEAELLLL